MSVHLRGSSACSGSGRGVRQLRYVSTPAAPTRITKMYGGMNAVNTSHDHTNIRNGSGHSAHDVAPNTQTQSPTIIVDVKYHNATGRKDWMNCRMTSVLSVTPALHMRNSAGIRDRWCADNAGSGRAACAPSQDVLAVDLPQSRLLQHRRRTQQGPTTTRGTARSSASTLQRVLSISVHPRDASFLPGVSR